MEVWHTGATKLWRVTGEGAVLHEEMEVTGIVLHDVTVTFGAPMPSDVLISFPNGTDWAVTLGGDKFLDEDVIMRFRDCQMQQGYIGPVVSTGSDDAQLVRIAVLLHCQGGMWIK